MAKIPLDACVPHWLRKDLSDDTVETARYAGLDELPDSRILEAIEGRYDVFVMLDGNIPFQQRVVGRSFAVIVLRLRDQSPDSFKAIMPALKRTIPAKAGEVHNVAQP